MSFKIKDLKMTFLGVIPILKDETGYLRPQDIVALSALMTFKGKSVKDLYRQAIDKGQNINEKVKTIIRKSSLRGHASIATTPAICFTYEASKFLDSMMTGMVFSSSLMASGRRTDTTIDDIVFPTAIDQNKKAKELFKKTSEENINFFSGIYGVSHEKRKERREWVLEMASLKDKRNTITRTLSGGFKQRLALGCAILHEPPILFLDEPTSGVDPISRRNFWNLIYEMSQTGTTIFVTTHYMNEADYCDRLALIYRGRIIAEGTPNELKQEYMKRDVLEIEVDRVVDAMEVIEKNKIETAIFGSLLHATVDDAELAIPQIKRILTDSNIIVNRIEKVVPSLEDVFVTLIELS